MKTTAAMCSEKEVLWNKCVQKTLIKITGDTAFLKINSLVNHVFEEVRPEFQLVTFMNPYWSKQLVLHFQNVWYLLLLSGIEFIIEMKKLLIKLKKLTFA